MAETSCYCLCHSAIGDKSDINDVVIVFSCKHYCKQVVIVIVVVKISRARQRAPKLGRRLQAAIRTVTEVLLEAQAPPFTEWQ